MCLAIPSKIIKIGDGHADVDVGGIIKRVNVTFIDGPKVGEYVLVHAGFAIQKIAEKEAAASLDVWREMMSDS